MSLSTACCRIAAGGLALLAATGLSSCGGPAASSASELSAAQSTAFALRDPRAGAPADLIRRADQVLLDDGMAALRSGALSRASKLFRKGDARTPKGVFLLGLAYVALAEGKSEEAESLLGPLLEGPRALPAAIEAMADLDASLERWRDATLRYRAAEKLYPGDSRIAARLRSAVEAYTAGLKEEAQTSLEAGYLEEARRAGLALVDVAPSSPEGWAVLARTAAAGAKPDDAWAWATRARALGARDAAWREFQASLAMKSRRFGDAVELYSELAATDPTYEESVEEARFEFRIENLPESARKAALSPRVTRAQLATLLWWTIPEVRETNAPPTPDVATDVIDHAERQALVRAIGLGFLSVSRETHRVRVDAPVARGEFSAVLKRLAQLMGRGRRPVRCLSGDSGIGGLAACGILPESKSRTVSGKEALRAIERTARLAREGGS